MSIEARLRGAMAAIGHARAVLDQRCVQDNGDAAPDQARAAAGGSLPATAAGMTVTLLAPNASVSGASGIVGFQGSSAYLEPLIRICSGWIILLR